MVRWKVELTCEQAATVPVEAPEDATEAELRELALQRIDAGEYDWDVTGGFVHVTRER